MADAGSSGGARHGEHAAASRSGLGDWPRNSPRRHLPRHITTARCLTIVAAAKGAAGGAALRAALLSGSLAAELGR